VHAGVGFDDDVAHDDVVGVEQVDGPHGRAEEAESFDQDVPAVHGADEGGTELGRGGFVDFAGRGGFDFEQLQEALPVGAVGAARVGTGALLAGEELHPFGVVAGEDAAAGDGDVFQTAATDQWHGRERFDALLAAFGEG
jgi:hypothetical protein